MKKRYWISLLVLLFVALVVKAMPAQFVLGLTKPPVLMDGVSGTIWKGKAGNVVLPYQGSFFSLGKVEWQLNPFSLLLLKPCAKINAELEAQEINGNVCASAGGDIVLKNTTVSIPARAAEIWAPVSIEGEIFLNIEELDYADNTVKSLTGDGSWNQARYHNSQAWMSLGQIAFELKENDKGGIHAKVFDIEGPMKLDLNSNFSIAGAYDIRGDIELRQNAPQEISQMLSIIAQQKGQNKYYFEWVGN